jgi:nondiscriminating aspartyl-tRNA synthetase
MERSLTKEALSKVGEEVKLQGWAENVRRMGKITFIELRDRSGKVQTVYESKIESLPIESVIEIVGIVKERPDSQVGIRNN